MGRGKKWAPGPDLAPGEVKKKLVPIFPKSGILTPFWGSPGPPKKPGISGFPENPENAKKYTVPTPGFFKTPGRTPFFRKNGGFWPQNPYLRTDFGRFLPKIPDFGGFWGVPDPPKNGHFWPFSGPARIFGPGAKFRDLGRNLIFQIIYINHLFS